jgi:cytochrome P450
MSEVVKAAGASGIIRDGAEALRLAFDPVDPICQADPVPYYMALLEAPPVQFDRGLLTTVISRYSQALEVLRDHKRFSSLVPDIHGTERFPRFGAQNFTFTDPPAHTRLRRMVASSFAPRKIEVLAQGVDAAIDRLYDRMEDRGEIEFVSEFSTQLPMMTIGAMLEWPEEDYDFLRGLITYLFEQAKVPPGAPTPPEILKVYATQREYFSAMIEKRRRNPGQDLISAVIAARDEKSTVDDEELLGLVVTVVLGGVPTTSEMLTFMVYELLNHPGQLEALRANPALAAGAVEETLRYDPPVNMTPRFPLEDVEIGGVVIPAGSVVWVVMAAANRDPAVFKDPGKFDIRRDPNDHLAFGEGVHFCIGAPTARLQGRKVASTIFGRFPRMRIAPGFIPTHRGTAMSRGMADLRLIMK